MLFSHTPPSDSTMVLNDDEVQLNYVWLENNLIKPVTIRMPLEHREGVISAKALLRIVPSLIVRGVRHARSPRR